VQGIDGLPGVVAASSGVDSTLPVDVTVLTTTGRVDNHHVLAHPANAHQRREFLAQPSVVVSQIVRNP
jgi:hypothetical protein